MIRPAQSRDAAIVHALVHETYGHSIPRLRRVPGRMKDDYERRTKSGCCRWWGSPRL